MLLSPGSVVPVCLPNVALNNTEEHSSWISHRSTSGDAGEAVNTHLFSCDPSWALSNTRGGFLTGSGSLSLRGVQVSNADRVACNTSAQYRGRIAQDGLCARGTHAHVRPLRAGVNPLPLNVAPSAAASHADGTRWRLQQVPHPSHCWDVSTEDDGGILVEPSGLNSSSSCLNLLSG